MKNPGFGRVVNVLGSPTKTFRSIIERPTWLVALLVLLVLAALSAGLAAPKIDWRATLETKLHRIGADTVPEGSEGVLTFLEEHGVSLILGWTVVWPWIIYPLLAWIFLRLFNAMGSELSFRTSLGVIVHGFMPWAVASLISIPILLATESLDLYDPGFGTLSLAAFAVREPGLERWILLNGIDLFSLWTVALLVIGYGIATKLDKVRVATTVVGLWAAWIAFMVAMAALE